MASWSHAQAVTVDPVRRPHTGTRTRTRRKAQPRARGGIVWIVVSGILLAGVVFVNVAVLQLNLALDSSNSDRTKLIAQNAALESQYSQLISSQRIQQQAVRQLGLQYSDPSTYGYVNLAK